MVALAVINMSATPDDPVPAVPPRDRKKLPFFLYSYIDKDLVVGRGRGGGLAVWARADKVRCYMKPYFNPNCTSC